MLEAARDQMRTARELRTHATARLRQVLAPIETWNRPLCHETVRPVRSPWDDEVRRAFERIVRTATDELPRDREVVVVDGLLMAPAAVCGHHEQITVMLSAAFLDEMNEWSARATLLTRFVAHELAHVALGHLALGDLSDHGATLEQEAEELAAFYLERSGTPCRDWVDVIGIPWTSPAWPGPDAERVAIAQACELARRGERPPRRLNRTTPHRS